MHPTATAPGTTPQSRRPALAALLRPLPDGLTDGAPAVVLFAAMLAERLGAADRIGSGLPYALVLTVLLAAAVAVRRRFPLTSYLIGTLVLGVEAQAVLPSPVSPYANLFGAWALGRYGSARLTLCGPPIVVVGVAGYFVGQDTDTIMPIGVLGIWLAVWAFGWATARRIADQAVQRRRAREELLAEERARIAREVHDLVGHSLSLMLVQAGAARRLLDREDREDPDDGEDGEDRDDRGGGRATGRGRSRALLAELEQTGNDALGELDRVLGLLRGPAPHRPGAAPASEPGLAELPRLVGRMNRAGLRVTLAQDAPPLPADQDRCAYRVVQEALTNSLRHSGARHAEVRIAAARDGLEVEVRDDGSGPPPGHRPGRGLTGIAERAARLHGTAEHGPGPDGGFRLRVTLPL
ncbi:sensor histidine kinase [Kitasatospora sp. NPDC088391]|uniref:sensor histidine kinase n=1 Tax=Kitasatospora sp. NPDC088391 TaxID=3364074 RepID=UPI00381FF87C